MNKPVCKEIKRHLKRRETENWEANRIDIEKWRYQKEEKEGS